MPELMWKTKQNNNKNLDDARYGGKHLYPSSQEAEAGGALWGQGQAGLDSNFQASRSYVVRPFLKTKKNNTHTHKHKQTHTHASTHIHIHTPAKGQHNDNCARFVEINVLNHHLKIPDDFSSIISYEICICLLIKDLLVTYFSICQLYTCSFRIC